MKKQLIECDRCGKAIPSEEKYKKVGFPRYKIVFEKNYIETRELDLCTECKKEFKDFIGEINI